MKKIINKSALLLIILLAHLLINTSIFAQAPQKMSYQAVIRNTSGALVTSASVGMKISILQGTATGTVAYSETQIASTNANGLVSLEIGAGTVVTGTFSGINWANGPYFIKTETDPLGGTNYSITGTNELMSVPYALFSANGTPGPQGPQGVAGTPGNDGATGAQGIQGPAGTFPPGTVPGEMNYWNGTAWVTVPPGISISGAPLTLRFCNGVPTWGSAYGNPCAAILPTVTTAVSDITSCSANGECISASGFGLQSWGICWSTSPNPTVDNNNVEWSYMGNLVPNTTYYVRAYAINSVGIAYGNQVSFTTLSVEIITTAVSDISGCTALSGGQSNLCNVYSSGVCWSNSTNPTLADSHTQDGGSSFTSYLSGLIGYTTYYVRAYVTDNNGVSSYGNQVSFTTAFTGLVTTAVSEITGCTALIGGLSAICEASAVGVCWSTSANPTLINFALQAQDVALSFNIYINGLIGNTTYYARAYATNENGLTYYGNQVSFTTGSLCIGQSYQGGIIAYIDASGIHGIIAAPSDQSTGAKWGCFFTSEISGADGTAIGTGAQNTIDIMNSCSTAGIAARLCGDLVLGGYSDWYLPSKDELNQLFINSVAIGGFASSGGYWSSTEFDNYKAWMSYNQWSTYTDIKIQNYYSVRAVRAF